MNTTPPPPPPPPPPAATPAPQSSGASKLLIILLCIFFAFVLLIGGCFVACTYFVKKKAAEINRNPQLATISMAAALSPDIQIVSKDENTGTITLRNKRTGEVTTIHASDYSTENITKALQKFSQTGAMPPPKPSRQESNAENDNSNSDNGNDNAAPAPTARPSQTSDNSNSASAEDTTPKVSPARAAALRAQVGKLPSAITGYPGAKLTNATIHTINGMTIGSYEFYTTDKADDVVATFQKKLTDANYTIAGQSSDSNDYGPVDHLLATKADPEGSVGIQAESKNNQTLVTVSYTSK